MQTNEKIEAFDAIRKENYNLSMGWSTFTECFDASDIARWVADFAAEATDAAGVRAAMAECAEVDDERHSEAQAMRDEFGEGGGY